MIVIIEVIRHRRLFLSRSDYYDEFLWVIFPNNGYKDKTLRTSNYIHISTVVYMVKFIFNMLFFMIIQTVLKVFAQNQFLLRQNGSRVACFTGYRFSLYSRIYLRLFHKVWTWFCDLCYNNAGLFDKLSKRLSVTSEIYLNDTLINRTNRLKTNRKATRRHIQLTIDISTYSCRIII